MYVEIILNLSAWASAKPHRFYLEQARFLIKIFLADFDVFLIENHHAKKT